MMANSKILSVLVFGLAACASAISIGLGRNEKRQLEVPIVDLGYEVHEGVVNVRCPFLTYLVEQHFDLISFQNIRNTSSYTKPTNRD